MRIWEHFPLTAGRIRQAHEDAGLQGHHDFYHAFRVGEVAQQVALAQWDDKRLSLVTGLAGLSHNADRLLQKKLGIGRRDVPFEAVVKLVTDWNRETLTVEEVACVVDAVLRHDGKNSAEDSKVLIALKDADRIVNLDVDLFIRSGQYYHDLPVVDYQHFLEDPEATYRNPKTVLRDIAYSLDWANPESDVCVRTRLGKKLAECRVTAFQRFFDDLKAQLAAEGMHPFPL